MAIDGVSHRTAGHSSAQTHLPESLTRARIQSKEVAFSSSGKEHVRRGGEHPTFGVVLHFEFPLLFAGLWFDGDDRSVSLVIRFEDGGVSVPPGPQAAAAVFRTHCGSGARGVAHARISFALGPGNSSFRGNPGAVLP